WLATSVIRWIGQGCVMSGAPERVSGFHSRAPAPALEDRGPDAWGGRHDDCTFRTGSLIEEEACMKVTIPELALIAGTRGLLGVGIGLLVAGKLSDDQRRAVGRTLLAIG